MIGRLFSASLVALSMCASAQSALFIYEADLDGPSESPPNASPGSGFGTFTYDDAAHTLGIDFIFGGLVGTTTAAHIHAPTVDPGLLTAGVATTTPTFAGTPIGVTNGLYSTVLDLTMSSSYNPSYVTANGGTPATAEVALIAAINAGKAYLNIHTSAFPGGEIRGFLQLVPEPCSMGMGAVALATLAGFRRQRRRGS